MGLTFLVATLFALFVLTASAITSYRQTLNETKSVGSPFFGQKPKVIWKYPIIFSVASFIVVMLMGILGA